MPLRARRRFRVLITFVNLGVFEASSPFLSILQGPTLAPELYATGFLCLLSDTQYAQTSNFRQPALFHLIMCNTIRLSKRALEPHLWLESHVFYHRGDAGAPKGLAPYVRAARYTVLLTLRSPERLKVMER